MPPPLITAIKEKKLEEVQQLIDNGADLESSDQKYQESVLFTAIKSMDPKILDMILSHKHESGKIIVNINKKNPRTEHTPLHWAIVNRNLYAVERLLICESIKLNEKNTRGDTPLHLAVDKNFVKVVWALSVQPNINFDALNKNKLKPEEVNSGGSESHKARILLKEIREQIEKHPDRKYLLIQDIQEVRCIMSTKENVKLPEVKPVQQNNMYVNISNITAQNVSVAGGDIKHFQGNVNICNSEREASATNTGFGAVEVTPLSHSCESNQQATSQGFPPDKHVHQSYQQQTSPSYIESQGFPHGQDLRQSYQQGGPSNFESQAFPRDQEVRQSNQQKASPSNFDSQGFPRDQHFHQSFHQQISPSHVESQGFPRDQEVRQSNQQQAPPRNFDSQGFPRDQHFQQKFYEQTSSIHVEGQGFPCDQDFRHQQQMNRSHVVNDPQSIQNHLSNQKLTGDLQSSCNDLPLTYEDVMYRSVPRGSTENIESVDERPNETDRSLDTMIDLKIM